MIILWGLGVLFALGAVLDVWLMIHAARGSIHSARIDNPQQLVRAFYRGAVANAAIAMFCFVGWHLMRRHTRRALLAGGLAVATALFTTSARWLLWEIAGRTQMGWLEPVLTWPPLAYAVIYAYRESSDRTNSHYEASKPAD